MKQKNKGLKLDHPLVSRRDFLGAGLIAGSSYLIAPKFIDLLLNPASAATCPSVAGMIPFVSIELAGGAAMSGNFVPQNIARSPISSYNVMGLGDKNVPIEREFGNSPWAGYADGSRDNNKLISKFLKGMRATGALALQNTAFCAVCVRSRDDSGDNLLSVNGLLSSAGLSGSMFNNISTTSSASGSRSLAALYNPPAPLKVGRVADLRNSIGYTAAAGTALNAKQKGTLAKLVQNLNSNQTRKLASIKSSSDVQNLLDCAGIKNTNLISNAAAADIDPVTSPDLAAVWQINGGMNDNSEARVHSSMVYNALKGNAGSVNLEMGGYDYHDNTRTSGDAADERAGRKVGQILESARILNKPVFVYVSTDGAVSSVQSETRDSVWNSDRGTASAAYMFYFNPTGRVPTKDFQIGQFTDGQVADDKVPASNPQIAAAVVYANWLKLNGRMDLLTSTTGRLLADLNLDPLIVF